MPPLENEAHYHVKLPLTEVITASLEASHNGNIIARTLQIRDANKKLFSLHVETQTAWDIRTMADEMESEAADDNDEPQTVEPTFVMPINSIDDAAVEALTYNVGEDLLALYLVEQEEV